jgi:PST family polysaccharide transporter
LKNKSNSKSLIENFLSLSVLQALNMFLPLLIFPYIVRVIGVDYFGILNVVLSILMLFNIFISFGFELSATKTISTNRNDIKKLSEIFFLTLYSKFLLLIVSVLIFLLLFQNINYISENILLFYMTSGLLLGNLLFPTWFYQGIEQMKYITIISAVIKVIATISIFVFITEKNDYFLLPLINSIAAIISGLVAIYFAIKKFKLIFFKPNFYQIKEQLKSSFHFFLSRVANQGSRHLAITLVGANFGNITTGYYTIADKLYMSIISLGGVVSQTIYPYMSAEKNLILFKKIFKFVMIVICLVLIPVFYYNEELLYLIFNLKNQVLSDIFMIFMISVPLGIISQLIGFPLLAAFGFSAYANNSLIYSAVIYIIALIFVTLYLNQILFIAYCSLLFRFTQLSFRLFYIKKTGLLSLLLKKENE